MTDLDALRARDAEWGVVALRREGTQAEQDRRALLAEVGRLTAALGKAACAPCEGDTERARIRAAVEGLRDACHPDDERSRYLCAAVLAAIDEEPT